VDADDPSLAPAAELETLRGRQAWHSASYHQPVAKSEVRLSNGDTFQLAATIEEAEKQLSDAARSGQSRLAWFTEAASGERVGINPVHVASLRAADRSG
jgi:hypothetical protein